MSSQQIHCVFSFCPLDKLGITRPEMIDYGINSLAGPVEALRSWPSQSFGTNQNLVCKWAGLLVINNLATPISNCFHQHSPDSRVNSLHECVCVCMCVCVCVCVVLHGPDAEGVNNGRDTCKSRSLHSTG